MPDYVRLLQANNAIQSIGDDTYWLCVTRTVQESKLFPVPSYMLLSYLCAFYRYPELLRKVEHRAFHGVAAVVGHQLQRNQNQDQPC